VKITHFTVNIPKSRKAALKKREEKVFKSDEGRLVVEWYLKFFVAQRHGGLSHIAGQR